MKPPLRIAFVPGVTPDKWARIWRERYRDVPIELTPVGEADQRRVLFEDEADMCFVRLPVDKDGLHLIRLYDEAPVVVVGLDHPVAAYDEIPLADLVDEQLVVGDVPGWEEMHAADPLPFPEMSLGEAFEVVATGTGMAIVPMSVARLHHRKDLVSRPVLDVPETSVGLAWRVELDDERAQDFIGVVRGRRANSSRGRSRTETAPKKGPKKGPAKGSKKPRPRR
ncbi:MAG: LysR family substrate-binding domain-containing protein [Nocardioides sp.]|nr:LysR family substrate-binding domain-containing protein [Nocardioides sp.]